MTLIRLIINNFRNIKSADLALYPVFNFLLEPNGNGKTSVLESIYAIGHGRIFCSLQANHVIRCDQDSFVLHGRILDNERKVSISHLTKNRNGNRKIRIDGSNR